MLGGTDVFLDAGQLAQLGFHPDPPGVGIVHHLFGQGDIFLIGQVRTVDHHRSEAAVNAVLAHLEAGAVVQMHHHGHGGVFDQGGLHQFHDVGLTGVFAGSGGNLEDHRGFFLGGGPHDALDDFHIVDVERAYGVAPGVGGGEHFSGTHKRHGFLLFCLRYGPGKTWSPAG